MGSLALPRTIYLWLALLLASMLLGPRQLKPSPTNRSAQLSSEAFERNLDAEYNVRVHFGMKLVNEGSLGAAHQLYRDLALKANHRNAARKALILAHQLKFPPVALDNKILECLPATERPLWRGLYGSPPSPLPLGSERTLTTLRLGLLEKQALTDLAQRRGDPQTARFWEMQRDEQARRRLYQLFGFLACGLVAGITGLGLLLFTVFVAVRREWHLLGRIPEPSSPQLGWGDLLDGFVFYLALYRTVGLLVSFALTARSPLIPLHVIVQFLTGFIAIAYLAAKAKKRGTSLRELGVSGARLGANILYGLGGYLASLPLVWGLGWVAKKLFEHSTNTIPNAGLTLMSDSRTNFERGLLFTTISVGAPLFEEFFFRGALFTGLRRRFAGLPSILLSTIVFACVHPPQDWLPIIGLGVSFAAMRHLRQSLVPGIVAHFLQNTVTFLFLRAIFGE